MMQTNDYRRTHMSKEDEDRSTLDEIYAAFFSGDLDRWLSFWTEESIIWEAESLPYGGTYRGLEQIKKLAEKMGSLWTDLNLEIHEILGSDERLMAYGTWNGTGQKTGKRVTFPFAEMWVLKDGKVIEVVPIYSDTALINSVLT